MHLVQQYPEVRYVHTVIITGIIRLVKVIHYIRFINAAGNPVDKINLLMSSKH